jgi:TolB protein
MKMTQVTRWGVSLGVVLALGGCELLDGGGGGGGGGNFSFSQGYAFIREDAQGRNVYLADRTDLAEVKRLTTSGNNRHPAISPDGRTVVFVHRTPSGTELQRVATTGDAEPSVLLASDTTKQNFAYPSFAPDGTRIAFGFERGGASYIGLVDADGSGFRELGTGVLSYASPTFYPDGRFLLVAAGNGANFTQLERLDTTTGAGQSVVSSLGNEATAIRNRVAISPDGTRAAFDGQLSSGATRIFVVDLSSRAVLQLTDYPGDPTARDSFPCWSGSTQVSFSSDTGGADQVYAISATTNRGTGALRLPSALEPWFGP